MIRHRDFSRVLPPVKSGKGSLIQLIDGPDGPQLGAFDDPMKFCGEVVNYTFSQGCDPRRHALKRLADETRRQAHLQVNDTIGSYEVAKRGAQDFGRIVVSCFNIANWGERSRKATEGKIRYTRFKFWRDAIEYVIAACDELRDKNLPCEKFRMAQQEVGARTPYLFLHPLLHLGDLEGRYPLVEFTNPDAPIALSLNDHQRLRLASSRLANARRRVLDASKNCSPADNPKAATEKQADMETHALFRGPYGFEVCWLHWPPFTPRQRGCPDSATTERSMFSFLTKYLSEHDAGKAAEALFDIFRGQSVRGDEWRDSKLRFWIDANKEKIR